MVVNKPLSNQRAKPLASASEETIRLAVNLGLQLDSEKLNHKEADGHVINTKMNLHTIFSVADIILLVSQ